VHLKNEFLKDREPKRGSNGKEIQSNVIDNESVKMPSSHGVIQGYNAQALVDSKHQVILAAEAFANQDHENLAPMLIKRSSTLPKNHRDDVTGTRPPREKTARPSTGGKTTLEGKCKEIVGRCMLPS